MPNIFKRVWKHITAYQDSNEVGNFAGPTNANGGAYTPPAMYHGSQDISIQEQAIEEMEHKDPDPSIASNIK